MQPKLMKMKKWQMHKDFSWGAPIGGLLTKTL
jgi:hypothetical protein